MAEDPHGTAGDRIIQWSDQAVADLISIRTYIAQFAPLAAQRFAVRLISAAESLVVHPERGRLIAAGKTPMRELLVVSPYLIRYRITTNAVQIVRVRHGARRP